MTCAVMTLATLPMSGDVRVTPARSAMILRKAGATLSPVLAETKKLQHSSCGNENLRHLFQTGCCLRSPVHLMLIGKVVVL